jgi:RNA polymerase sigma-70 factor (ECF subfamily)
MKPVIGIQPVRTDAGVPVESSAAPLARHDPSDSLQAAELKALVHAERWDEAREILAGLVKRHQRRASRLAYYLLRDAADADEAVQDAFIKVFSRIDTYREGLPFEAWFNRILVNGCLDRRKARSRRERWLVGGLDATHETRARASKAVAPGRSPEEALLDRERRKKLMTAIDRLPARQRTVFLLCHQDGRTTHDVGQITGLNESTVRVHLFRAIRKLRGLLGANA